MFFISSEAVGHAPAPLSLDRRFMTRSMVLSEAILMPSIVFFAFSLRLFPGTDFLSSSISPSFWPSKSSSWAIFSSFVCRDASRSITFALSVFHWLPVLLPSLWEQVLLAARTSLLKGGVSYLSAFFHVLDENVYAFFCQKILYHMVCFFILCCDSRSTAQFQLFYHIFCLFSTKTSISGAWLHCHIVNPLTARKVVSMTVLTPVVIELPAALLFEDLAVFIGCMLVLVSVLAATLLP